MSVTNETYRVQVTLATAVQAIPVTFYFLEQDDLIVYQTVAGVDTLMVLNTNYTLTGEGVEAGGTLTTIGGTVGAVWTIARADALTQSEEFIYSGSLSASSIERAYDRLAMQIQRVFSMAKRALRFPITAAEGGELGDVETRKGMTMQFNATTGALELVDSAESSATAAAASAAAALDSEVAADISADAAAASAASIGFTLDTDSAFTANSDTRVPSQKAVKTALTAKPDKSANLSDVASPATAFANIKQAASESASGVVELATTAEAVAGVSTSLVPTPEGVAYEVLAANAGYDLGARNDIGNNPQRDLVKLFNNWLSETPNGLNFGKSVAIGARRNLWQYTENLGHASYSATNLTKGTDTVVVDGVTLTKLTAPSFYSILSSNFAGLGLTPFVTGNYYLFSCFVLSAQDHEQWPFVSPTGNNANAFKRKLVIPGKVRRVWQLGRALSNNTLDMGDIGTIAYGLGAPTFNWHVTGGYPDGNSSFTNSMVIYVGGFQIEEVVSDGKWGIVGIGDSTMQGSAGTSDSGNSLEWMVQLGAHLNVDAFNRGVGGEQTTAMDARWATDITPLAARAKYAIIQPSAANDIPNGVSLATTQGAVNSMVAKAIADSLIPVLVVPPSSAGIDANSGYEATYASLCAWIRQTFPLVIDNAKVCNDPLNPYQLRRQVNWIGDGTHFGSEAKRAIALNAASYPWWDFPRPSPYQPIAVTTFTAPTFSVGTNLLTLAGALTTSGANSITLTTTGPTNVTLPISGTLAIKPITATATLDFPSIAAAASADLTITVTGAVAGYSVVLGLPTAPTAGIVFNGFVSAADTVTIRATNITLVAVDPASATYRATVFVP